MRDSYPFFQQAAIRVAVMVSDSSPFPLSLFLILNFFIVDFDFGVGLERAQRLVAPRDDLLPFLEPGQDFDLRLSGNPCGDWNKHGFSVAQNEDTLFFFLLRRLGSGNSSSF